MQLPWEPLFTIERSGQPEVTVSGIISVLDGRGRSLLASGDVDYPLWSRSCLKPFQLLGHYELLKKTYPELEPAHFALMASSHGGEAFHIERLRQIMAIGGVDESLLQCPAGFSWHAGTRFEQKRLGLKPSSLFADCSGKHFGFLMAMKARHQDLSDYLNPDGEQFVEMRHVLSWLLKRSSEQFATTTDGCRLPNYALSARELASLYCLLLQGVPQAQIAAAPPELRPLLENVREVGAIMRRFPELIGGSDRLDTRLISRELTDNNEIAVVAKEGAAGLLSVGIGTCPRYPDGLGILIKLSSGYDALHSENIIKTLLEQLGLRTPPAEIDYRNKHIVTKFHFHVLDCQTV